MPRLQAIDPNTATGKAKELLNAVHAKLGMTPNLLRTLANAPAVLEAYLGFATPQHSVYLAGPAKIRFSKLLRSQIH